MHRSVPSGPNLEMHVARDWVSYAGPMDAVESRSVESAYGHVRITALVAVLTRCNVRPDGFARRRR